MGSGKWKDTDWNSYSSTMDFASKSRDEIFTSRGMDKDLNPLNVMRESRDSTDNPNSTPIIVALDVTGSMGMIPEQLVRGGLNKLCTEIFERKPVTDPHLMFAAIGDVEYDSAPLQVTQFEADIRIAEQLTKLYLEGGGGGNLFESYALAWLFAWSGTTTDSWVKRKKKGYLFTIGDELPTGRLRKDDIKAVLGQGPQEDLSSEQVFAKVSNAWECFHLLIDRIGHNHNLPAWQKVMGEQRVIPVQNHELIPEIIISVMQAREGAAKAAVTASWTDPGVQKVIGEAIKMLPSA